MYAKIKTKRNIFNNKNLDLTPVLRKIIDLGSGDEEYHYTFFIGVDQLAYETLNVKNIETSITPELSIREMKQNVGKSAFKNTTSKLENSITKRLLNFKNMFFKEINKAKALKNQHILPKVDIADSIGKNSIKRFKNKSKTNKAVYGSVKSFKFIEVEKNKSKSDQKRTDVSFFDEQDEISKKTFNNKKNRIRMNINSIKSGIDVSKSYDMSNLVNKSTRKNSRKIIPKVRKKNVIKSRLQHDVSGIISKNNIQKTVIKKVYYNNSKRYISCPVNVNFKKSDLERLGYNGEDFILNFTMMSKSGLALDHITQRISHENFINMPNIDIDFDEFEISANYHSIFIAKPNTLNDITMVMHTKQIKPSEIFNKSMYKKTHNYTLTKNQNTGMLIFNTNSSMRNRYPLKINDNVTTFIRSTFKINGIDVDNCISTSIPSRKIQNYNYAPFYCKKLNDHILVNVNKSSLPLGTVKVTLLRRDYIDGVMISDLKVVKKTNFKEVVDSDGKSLDQILYINNNDGVSSFIDYDIKDERCYEYKLKVTFSDGTSVISCNSFEEQFEKPDNFINLKITDSDSSGNFDITVEKIESDADKVFRSLFGNYYLLFEDDIKQIRKLNANAVILKIDKINISTGVAEKFGEFEIDSENKARITNLNLIGGDDYLFRISTYIKPIADIISAIKHKIVNPRIKFKNKKYQNDEFAKFFEKINNTDDNVISSIGNKYVSRQKRIKGRLPSDKAENESIDSYFDGSTGDTFYHSSSKLSQNESNTLKIKNVVILKFKKKTESIVSSYRNQTNDEDVNIFMVKLNAKFRKSSDHILICTIDNGIKNVAATGHINHNKQIHNYIVKTHGQVSNLKLTMHVVDNLGNFSNEYILGTI